MRYLAEFEEIGNEEVGRGVNRLGGKGSWEENREEGIREEMFGKEGEGGWRSVGGNGIRAGKGGDGCTNRKSV